MQYFILYIMVCIFIRRSAGYTSLCIRLETYYTMYISCDWNDLKWHLPPSFNIVFLTIAAYQDNSIENKHGHPCSLLITYRLSMFSWLCEMCWRFTVYKTMVNVQRWPRRLCRWVRWGSRCLQRLDYTTLCHTSHMWQRLDYTTLCHTSHMWQRLDYTTL